MRGIALKELSGLDKFKIEGTEKEFMALDEWTGDNHDMRVCVDAVDRRTRAISEEIIVTITGKF